MSLLLDALTLGLIFSLLSLGILISFRIFAFADITTDGSLTTGACVATVLLLRGVPVPLATAAGFLAGCLGGFLTAVLYTRFKINGLLAGILVIPSLFALNLRLMGPNRVDLPAETTLHASAARWTARLSGQPGAGRWLAGEVWGADVLLLLAAAALVAAAVAVLTWFFRTQLGVAVRATGDNPAMARGLGVNVENMTILGLALANGLAGMCGALLAQYQGFADLQMGVGMIVWGLASVFLGEALLPGRRPARMLLAAVVGAVLYRLFLSLVLKAGLAPTDLKFVSALFVLAALLLPRWRQFVLRSKAAGQEAGRA